MEQKRIVTISREFGSGGRSIGKQLADQLGIKYYDKELVKQVAVETGFDPGFVEERGEFASNTSRFAWLLERTSGTPGVMNGLSTTDFLWLMQRNVILQLAEQEPCVIVGRCADYILLDRTDCLHAFIHADMAYRADRIVRLYGESEKSPEKRLQEKDTKRRLNYNHFTQQEWGMSQNYHISLNSGVIGPDRCVEILASLYRGEGAQA